jgi:hypothetical protein
MALESTQPLTEMSTRNLPGGKGRPARKSDNLTISQTYGPPRLVTGIDLSFFFLPFYLIIMNGLKRSDANSVSETKLARLVKLFLDKFYLFLLQTHS